MVFTDVIKWFIYIRFQLLFLLNDIKLYNIINGLKHLKELNVNN